MINTALRRTGYDNESMTGHGLSLQGVDEPERAGLAPEVIELQLAPAERNKIRAAYNRAQRLAE